LKMTKITPIPKVNNPTELCQHRPIGVSPILMSIIEKLYHEQLLSFVADQKLLHNNQFGGKRLYSTHHSMLGLVEILKERLNLYKYNMLVSLDYENYFPL